MVNSDHVQVKPEISFLLSIITLSLLSFLHPREFPAQITAKSRSICGIKWMCKQLGSPHPGIDSDH